MQKIGMFDNVKPDQPVIGYLAKLQAEAEEEEKKEQEAKEQAGVKVEKPKTCAFIDEDDDSNFDSLMNPKQALAPKKSVDLKLIADSGPLLETVDWAAGLQGGKGFVSEVVTTNQESSNPFASMQISPPNFTPRSRKQSEISGASGASG